MKLQNLMTDSDTFFILFLVSLFNFNVLLKLLGTVFLILFWLYYENSSLEKISNHMSYTLLYVIPTLPMFIIFPYFINKFGFYISIILSIILTILFVIIVHVISKKFGYKLI